MLLIKAVIRAYLRGNYVLDVAIPPKCDSEDLYLAWLDGVGQSYADSISLKGTQPHNTAISEFAIFETLAEKLEQQEVELQVETDESEDLWQEEISSFRIGFMLSSLSFKRSIVEQGIIASACKECGEFHRLVLLNHAENLTHQGVREVIHLADKYKLKFCAIAFLPPSSSEPDVIADGYYDKILQRFDEIDVFDTPIEFIQWLSTAPLTEVLSLSSINWHH
ncbi:MAG TPA: hypothetical protein V6D29_11170 [Leptolyngbyaceae cyanobacterium]